MLLQWALDCYLKLNESRSDSVLLNDAARLHVPITSVHLICMIDYTHVVLCFSRLFFFNLAAHTAPS